MSYFDSEKNKAMWAKRLAALEQERDRRKAEGYRPSDRKVKRETAVQVKEGVREITLKELIAREEEKRSKTVSVRHNRNREAVPLKEPKATRTM